MVEVALELFLGGRVDVGEVQREIVARLPVGASDLLAPHDHGLEIHRFTVRPNRYRPGSGCRGCGRRGDAIDSLRQRQGVDFAEACRLLGASEPPTFPSSRPRPPATATGPLAHEPSSAWQAAAAAVARLVESGGRGARVRVIAVGGAAAPGPAGFAAVA